MFCYYLVIWRYKGVRHQTGQLSPACKCFRQDFSTNSSNIQSQLSRVWHHQREMWTPRSWVFCAAIVQWRWVTYSQWTLKPSNDYLVIVLYTYSCATCKVQKHTNSSPSCEFPPKSWLFSQVSVSLLNHEPRLCLHIGLLSCQLK